MHVDVNLAMQTLRQEGLTLAVSRNGSIVFKSRNRGVEDLYQLIRNRSEVLQDASAADKIVGKAAAMLYAAGGLRELYADNLSRAALGILRQAGIRVQCQKIIPFVMNRDRTGMCPVDRIASTVDTVEQLLDCLQHFFKEQESCG